MTRSCSFSLVLYRGLLRLYPADLRRSFGAEMLEMFAQDLAAARGSGGTLHLWHVTLRESLHVVLPEWWDTPEIAVPFLTSVFFLVANSPTFFFSLRSQPTTPLDALIGFSALCSFTALTSFLAVCRWMRSGLVTLRLS